MKIKQIISVLPCVVVVLSTVLHAQRVDTIRANPDAVQLRKIWEVTGGEFGGGRVGDGIGSVGDINGDGLDDWAVHYGTVHEWRVFYGSRDGLGSEPIMVLKGFGTVPSYPIVGDFWGTGHKAIGLPRGNYELWILRTDSLRIDTMSSTILDPHKMTPYTTISPQSIRAVDLDQDGADELILFTAGAIRNGNISRKPEVWIYRGGANFQVDTPTVVLQDSEENDAYGYQMEIGHFDSDGRPDIVMGFRAQGSGYKMNFYFSNAGSPWNWSDPDRVVASGGWDLGDMAFLDCDGDGLLDIAVPGPVNHISVFLSSSGQSLRARPLTFETSDRQYYAPYYIVPFNAGYLNDSSRRYAMLGVIGNGAEYLLSGGSGGPDASYGATTAGLLGRLRLLGDIDGDGWDDIMSGMESVNFDAGYASIYAGGPYIPRDASLGVRHIFSEERDDAISVWPNPATTEVHIAWRGDLQRMPRGFVVHDMLGRLVAEGEVSSWKGEVQWRCDGQPAGVYILSILDYQGERIATTQIVKA